MIATAPLLADISDVIILLVFLGISAVSWLFNQIREAAERAQKQQRPPTVRPPAVGEEIDRSRPVVVQKTQDPLADEIEEFLRRAAGRREPGPVAPPAPAKAPVAKAAPIPTLVQRPKPSPPLPAGQPIPRAGEYEPDVAAQVESRIPASQFDRQVAQLGADLEQTDERMEQHLHDAFDHQLGSLRQRGPAVPQQDRPTDATVGGVPVTADALRMALAGLDVHQLLSSPEGMRSAILLSEILQHPDSRFKDKDWTY